MSFNPPKGFLFSACAAGIKPSAKPDLALALAPEGAAASAMFTRNQVVAAPVTVGREQLRASKGMVNAVLVNAGNANCATGKSGIEAAREVCHSLAKQLRIRRARVFPSSTGIIGVPLPLEKIVRAIPGLAASAADTPDCFEQFASAILTTDTRRKLAIEQIQHKGKTVTLAGVAKGAGMIHPNMATMLVYLFTDVVAVSRDLQQALRPAVEGSFNCISIDGDTSTNDTVLLLASGKSGVRLKAIQKQFQCALLNVCRSLAQQIIADGEGVKHVVRLKIEQARTRTQAKQIARAIATSPLVKTAWAGADPNWGRILASIGYSEVKIKPASIDIFLGELQICRNGAAYAFDKNAAHQYMSQPEYAITVRLGLGKAALDFLSCDLTADYVHCNADYST